MHKMSFLALLLCLFFSFGCFGQEDDKSAAVLIDEFGQTNYSAAKARLDNAFIYLENAAPDSHLFIVTYRTSYEPVAIKNRFSRWMKLYLTRNRGLNPNLVVIIDGGEGDCSLFQIWGAPQGAAPKIKLSYQRIFDDKDLPQKFDEYYFAFENEFEESTDDSLDVFAAAVKKERGATAYVIVYPQYEGRYSNQTDAPNAAAQMAHRIRRDLIVKHKLAASKIRIANGGYRRLRQVELWILPSGVHPPVATPNAFPKANRLRRKRRA